MFGSARKPLQRWLSGLLGATVLAAGAPLLVAQPAFADSAPTPPTPRTVTADALPTVQVDGVVYDQLIVGNTVYVTGRFAQARPAGSAAGANQTARTNILAYNLSTGVLLTNWAPTLNGQGLTLDVSADGTRIYVGGEFTSVTGVARNRIVALNATDGSVVTSFNPNANSRVRSIDVDGNTLYLGGNFTTVGGQTRTRIAAVSASTGALTAWAPASDLEVFGVVAPAGSGKVVLGGRFTQINGSTAVTGLVALNAATAQVEQWESNGIFPNSGPNSAIYSLATDGTQVYGTAYDFYGPSPFEGTFAVVVNTGRLSWLTGCKGDTYDVAPVGNVVYNVSHAHNCSPINGNPEIDPRSYQYAQALTKDQGAGGLTNNGGDYPGAPAPELLHWLPTLTAGTFTGQSQAGWTVTGNSEYVLIGGEFPRVNGAGQQGLVRFRTGGPNTQAPLGYAELKPSVISLAPGAARIAWTSAWDRDNRKLTYEVLRGASLGSATVVGTVTNDSAWWNRKPLAFTDTTVTAGSTQTYRIRAKDPFNNVLISETTTATVQGGTAQPSPYGDAVRADSAVDYWRLGEPDGTVSYDWVGGADLAVDGSAVRGTAGALTESNAAITFSGNAAVPATPASPATGPQTFSVEAWFNTTTTSGGKIVGFGNSTTGDSSGYDRHIYMTNDGRIVFGIFPGAVRTITSAGPFNNGQWHHAVGTLGPAGMELFLDGKRVGRRTDTTTAQPYSGVWRIGGDNLGGWENQPASNKFAGAIDEVAVYPAALSAERVQAHFAASGRQLQTGVRPTDAYGSVVYDAQPENYWRLNETSGDVAADITINAADGRYFDGTVQGAPGVPGLPGTAIRLDGADDSVAAAQSVDNPTVYSEELWFNTTTTRGGKLIGFGRAQTGGSGSYDRHVYMFDDGRLTFGAYSGALNQATTPLAYNNGQWHHMVATMGSDGMKLYLDGAQVAENPNTVSESYPGFWRVGGDNTWGGASSNYFAGSIDEVAIYSSALSAAQVADHFTKGGGQPPNGAPTAAFSSNPTGLDVSFDGAASTDADGTIATYAWNFGDGTTGTGVTTAHTYGAAGTFDVTLTVTDDDGTTNAKTQPVTVTAAPANAPPTAAFTSTANNLAAAFDGSTSTDTDGTIATYAWNFGDTTTGTGATTPHTYPAAGTYNVTLTVTDNGGATNATSKPITVTAAPANAPPTAAFTSTANNLAAAFDGSTSTDTDGTIATYAWNFGDTTTGTGATTPHTYPAAGTYNVTLTVTDNGGATNATTKPITVTAAPPAATTYATDTFARTVASGFGTADSGGAWTTSGGAADFSVGGGTGKMRLPAAGAQRMGYLNSVSQTDTEVNVSVALDKAQTGGGTYVSVIGRRVGTSGDYRTKVRYLASGAVSAQLVRVVGSAETVLSTATVAGLTYAPGEVLRIRLQVGGSGTTALATKIWRAGQAEPAAWLTTATDTTAALQANGGVGLVAYLSGSSTNSPIVASFDDLVVGPRQIQP